MPLLDSDERSRLLRVMVMGDAMAWGPSILPYHPLREGETLPPYVPPPILPPPLRDRGSVGTPNRLIAPPRTRVQARYRGGQSYQKNGRARNTPSPIARFVSVRPIIRGSSKVCTQIAFVCTLGARAAPRQLAVLRWARARPPR